MPELRFDRTTADWVVLAPLRKLRRHASTGSATTDDVAGAHEPCPFCPGSEALTPPPVHVVPGGPSGWRVRVIPNQFPALRIEEDHHRHDGDGMFQSMGGCGAHEVVIESPDHATYLSQQSLEQVELVLRAIRFRYVDLLRDPRFQSIVIFKNHGPGAGTSLRHPHWQIIALPVVPRLVRQKLSEATTYFDRRGRSLYQSLLDEELADGRRMIAANDDFAAFVPFAAHLPFETWIVPRRQAAAWNRLDDALIPALAEILQNVLRKLYVGLDNPDFNLTVDMAPRGDENEPHFRWHIRILPRLSTPAGFEMGSGMSINTVLPEEAAAFLRDGAPVESSPPHLVRTAAS